MKQQLKSLLSLVATLTLLPMLFACKGEKQEPVYKGINKIFLVTNNPVIGEDSTDPLVVKVQLTVPTKTDLKLTFKIMDDKEGVLRLEDNPVQIAAGQKEGTLKVFSNNKKLLFEDTYFEINLAEPAGDKMELDAPLRVRVTPYPNLPKLTPKQMELVKGYKEKYGIDVLDFIGVMDCHTVIKSPGGSALPPFVEPFTKEIVGKTTITLSEESTPDTPILKMEENPMGMTEYLYWVLRAETVEDGEYWTKQPAPQQLMEQIHWNKDSKENFNVWLDGIKLKDISKEKATLDYLGEKKDPTDENIVTVPFKYSFSAWDRQQKLMETSEAAKETYEQGGRANPDYYLCISTIAEDAWEDAENYYQSTGSIDFAAKKMTFKFLIDHTNAAGYSQVSVTYEKKN